MKSLILAVCALLCSNITFAEVKHINLGYRADNDEVVTKRLPKDIFIDRIKVERGEDGVPKSLDFKGLVSWEDFETEVKLKLVREDESFYYVAGKLISDRVEEGVCDYATLAEVVMSFRMAKDSDWTSDYGFEGTYRQTVDWCHSPLEDATPKEYSYTWVD